MKKQRLDISDANLELLRQSYPNLTPNDVQKGFETEQHIQQIEKEGVMIDLAYSEEIAAFLSYRSILRDRHLERLSEEDNKAAWKNIDEYFRRIAFTQLEQEDLPHGEKQ